MWAWLVPLLLRAGCPVLDTRFLAASPACRPAAAEGAATEEVVLHKLRLCSEAGLLRVGSPQPAVAPLHSGPSPPLQNPSRPLRHDMQHVSTLLALSLQHTCFVSQTRAFLTRPAVKDAVKGLCRVSLYFFISFLSFVFSARHFLYTILGFGCEASVGQIGLD